MHKSGSKFSGSICRSNADFGGIGFRGANLTKTERTREYRKEQRKSENILKI